MKSTASVRHASFVLGAKEAMLRMTLQPSTARSIAKLKGWGLAKIYKILEELALSLKAVGFARWHSRVPRRNCIHGESRRRHSREDFLAFW